MIPSHLIITLPFLTSFMPHPLMRVAMSPHCVPYSKNIGAFSLHPPSLPHTFNSKPRNSKCFQVKSLITYTWVWRSTENECQRISKRLYKMQRRRRWWLVLAPAESQLQRGCLSIVECFDTAFRNSKLLSFTYLPNPKSTSVVATLC